MRNRLNVTWQGSRTTVRFPDHLWQLCRLALSITDIELQERVKRTLAVYDRHCPDTTASEVVRDYLIRQIARVLDLSDQPELPFLFQRSVEKMTILNNLVEREGLIYRSLRQSLFEHQPAH